MYFPDDIWSTIFHASFVDLGPTFVKCDCGRSLVKKFISKPFVKHLETSFRLHRTTLITNRGLILEMCESTSKRDNILYLKQNDKVMHCKPHVTPDKIAFQCHDSNFIYFRNSHEQLIQLEPYHTYLKEDDSVCHVCTFCRYKKRLLRKCFNGFVNFTFKEN